jgi:hypothetical protein
MPAADGRINPVLARFEDCAGNSSIEMPLAAMPSTT